MAFINMWVILPQEWWCFVCCGVWWAVVMLGLVIFFPTPQRLITHGQRLLRRQPDPHLGHNPLGAMMMLVLWSVVIGLGVSGYLMGTEQFWGDETMEEIHEVLANSLIPLIALHVASALAMSFISKSNLVAAMITGHKNVPDEVNTTSETLSKD